MTFSYGVNSQFILAIQSLAFIIFNISSLLLLINTSNWFDLSDRPQLTC